MKTLDIGGKARMLQPRCHRMGKVEPTASRVRGVDIFYTSDSSYIVSVRRFFNAIA